MDILNHLDSESSSDSDGSAMKDHALVEDGRNESDQVTTTSTHVTMEKHVPYLCYLCNGKLVS